MKMKLIISFLFFVCYGLLSCNNESKTAAPCAPLINAQLDSLADYRILNELFDNTDTLPYEYDKMAAVAQKDPPYYGSKIKYIEIVPCLDAYKKIMESHGIKEDVTTPINIVLTKALKITYAEIFRGKELKEFLREAARKHSLLGSGKRLAVRIEFGIYTKEFTKLRDPSREGRIGIFLVTHLYKKDKDGKWRDDEEADEDAFDFGGIHP